MIKRITLSVCMSVCGMISMAQHQGEKVEKVQNESVHLSFALQSALRQNTLLPLIERTQNTSKAGVKQRSLKNIDLAKTGVIVRVKQIEKAETYLNAHDIQFESISDSVVVAEVTLSDLKQLAQCPYISGVQDARQFHPFMQTTRAAVNATYVQQGKDLDSPYNGEGVLIGVIDRGIQYKHIAFYNGSKDEPRAVRVWNHTIDGAMPLEKPATKDDNIGDTQGHGTHVANIAGGSDVGNGLYGIAPKADLFLCSSILSEDKVLSEVNFMRNYAKLHHQPLIINMSFGQQLGPHDGSGYYNQSISKMIEQSSEGDAPRFFVCAANGNERGLPIHTQGKFTSDVDTISVVMKYSVPRMGSVVIGDIWSDKADMKEHLKFKVYASDLKGKRTLLTPDQLERLYVGQSMDVDASKRQVFSFQLNRSSLAEVLALPLDSTLYLEVDIAGKPGDGFHGWCSVYQGSFGKGKYKENLKVDDNYLVGEGASCIPKAFSVAAYNALKPGQPIARFSSAGPWLGKERKPIVAAPGVNVMSAVSEYGMQNQMLVNTEKVASDMFGRKRWYYYQPMDGTSMATPVVTGVMALWLQANPKLTYEQIVEILHETSVHNKYNKKVWDANFGYGRIDAYEGIKAAIRLRRTDGIEEVMNSSSPLTIKKMRGEWNILFNSSESFADIRLINLHGGEVKRWHLKAVNEGDEKVIDLRDMKHGVYVLEVSTPNSTCAKKLVVE